MINSRTRKEIGLKSEFMCFVNEHFFTEKIVSVRVKCVVIVNFFSKNLQLSKTRSRYLTVLKLSSNKN